MVSSTLLVPFVVYRSLVALLSSLLAARHWWLGYIGPMILTLLLFGEILNSGIVLRLTLGLLFGTLFSALYFPTESFLRRKLRMSFPSPLENVSSDGQKGSA